MIKIGDIVEVIREYGGLTVNTQGRVRAKFQSNEVEFLVLELDGTVQGLPTDHVTLVEAFQNGK